MSLPFLFFKTYTSPNPKINNTSLSLNPQVRHLQHTSFRTLTISFSEAHHPLHRQGLGYEGETAFVWSKVACAAMKDKKKKRKRKSSS